MEEATREAPRRFRPAPKTTRTLTIPVGDEEIAVRPTVDELIAAVEKFDLEAPHTAKVSFSAYSITATWEAE